MLHLKMLLIVVLLLLQLHCQEEHLLVLLVQTCEFPAMRDLASMVHDLSRIHHSSLTTLELTPLRLALIDGWKSTAPVNWASDDAFYSHRGGLAIWEYEQCAHASCQKKIQQKEKAENDQDSSC